MFNNSSLNGLMAGNINLSTYQKKLNSAKTSSEARKIIKEAMQVAQKNVVGQTNSSTIKRDAQAVATLLSNYGSKWNANVSSLASAWNKATTIKQMKSATTKTTDIFDNYFTNGYQPNSIGNKRLRESGEKVTMSDGRTQNVWRQDGTGTLYVWEGNGNGGGKYITLHDFNTKYNAPKKNTNTGTWVNPYADENGNRVGSGSSAPATNNSAPVASSSSSVVTSDPIVQKPDANKIDWQKKDIDEMAAILGLETYKTADILKLYNDVTNKQFDELDTQVKRTQAENLRSLEGTYNDYLNTIRENRANAISNGMTKGAAAAEQLASMYANAQAISESQQKYYDSQYDIAQERATALATNATQAKNDRLEIEKYLGELRGTYEANSVNELAARLAYSSQLQDAKMQADATTNAAGITAAANRYAADVGYQSAAYQAANNTDDLYNMIRKAKEGDPVAIEYMKYYQQFNNENK